MSNNGKQIMIVEDEKGLRTLLTIMLERAGFTVIQASDAATALEMRSRSKPDLLVVDAMLRDINGMDLYHVLRQHPETASTPILLLSARGDREIAHASYGAGENDDYLLKPVMQRDLLHKVNSLLQDRMERPTGPIAWGAAHSSRRDDPHSSRRASGNARCEIEVDTSAWPSHEAHGDTLGSCP